MTDDRPTPMRMALRCARLLREGWHDKASLASRLEVTERTVKRYLSAIAAEEEGYETRRVDEFGLRQYAIRPPGVRKRREGNRYEILALAMAERFFRGFDPGGVADLLDQVLYEVTGEEDEADEADDRARKRASLARRFVLARAPQPLPGRVRHVFDRVLQALLERRVVDLDYLPRAGGERTYVFRPYTLLLGEQELAITGPVGEPEQGETPVIRTFALNRIAGIQMREARFSLPPLGAWNPDAVFGRAWGLYTGPARAVRVSIHPAFAGLVAERRWHPSQQVGVAGPDGWIPVRFDVFPDGEFRTWVLGWGPWLRVEEPSDLAAWVQRTRGADPGSVEPEPEELFRIV